MGDTVQTGAYGQYPEARYEGQIDTLEVGNNIGHAFAEGGDLAFGLAVCQGTADNQVLLATATGGAFRGITVRNNSVSNDSTTGLAAYAEGEAVTIRNFGSIVVLTESAVTKGDTVYFRHTAGAGGTTIGAIRGDADTASADAITGAYFAESAGAGELVRITLPTIY